MSAPAPLISPGQPIPDFSAETTGGPMRLSDFAGKMLVLYFYPKDNTPGCTSEAGDFSAAHEDFRQAGAEILGVSRDSLKSHASFREKLGIPFDLISDADEQLCQLFDVIKNKTLYGKQVRGIERSTFLIGPDGTLMREWRKVRVPGHVDEILQAVRQP
ncbi:MAG: peroxiredoxin [Lautropia sp.]|nr:peroxiredoxin [Lautropia sp.]